MKKILALALVLSLAAFAGTAFAEGMSADLTYSYASEPATGFDSTTGPTIGFNIDATAFGSSMPKPLSFRADISRYEWSQDFLIAELSYTRTAVMLGGRWMLPVEKVNLFGEGGLEISKDEAETAVTFMKHTIKASADETNTGVALGGGVKFDITDAISAGAVVRYHAVDDAYFTAGAQIGFAF